MSYLNAQEIYDLLKDKVLLCYEDPLLFCHRHIVAAWLESELGIIVPEVAIVKNKIIYLEQNKEVREDYKRVILEE